MKLKNNQKVQEIILVLNSGKCINIPVETAIIRRIQNVSSNDVADISLGEDLSCKAGSALQIMVQVQADSQSSYVCKPISFRDIESELEDIINEVLE